MNDVRPPHHRQRARPVLRDTAYKKFMDRLMAGHLKPGHLVSQRELCESTGSTIGAMREALKRLEAEGIVVLIPQRGVKVRELGEKEINDVYEVRKIVEPHAARVYADAGDLGVIGEIKSRIRAVLVGKAESRDEAAMRSREHNVLDDLLHQTVLGALDNHAIDEIFAKIWVLSQMSRIGVQPRFIDSRPAAREHLKIIEALESRDGEAAEKAMADHLEKSRRRAVGID